MYKRGERTQYVKIILVMLGVALWSLCILCRLVELQIVRHEEYAQSARKKQQRTRPVSAPRGIIYDGHMDELATNVTVSTVVAEPIKIRNKPEAARSLAAILNIDPGQLLQKMMNPDREWYCVVKQRIDPAVEADIKALKIDGLYFKEESMRVYPNQDLACHILGFVNWEGNAGEGIELQYEKVLKGEDGLFSLDVDARSQPFRVKMEKPPVQGRSLLLSIDRSIQYIADRELAAAVKDARAKAGTAIVMEADTGRILALSNYPRYNCNLFNKYEPALWRNRAITDMFEPGSTFKVVVATAALELGLTRPDDVIDCNMGSITLAGHAFRDHKPYGRLTFNEVLEHSSNVGSVKLGLRLGQQRLYEALRNFGFGSRTGVDLPGEIAGLVRHWQDWSGLSIGAISFGQEVGVTSMQILTAINAIANGGYLVRPSVVDRIIDETGNTEWEQSPERLRLMRPRTAEEMAEAFEGVVLRGTGTRAALEGYRAAGKTGTAQKIVDGRYSREKYLSSFIGFAPLPNPRVTILVQVDEPRNGAYYGGDVCAPYFKNIAQGVLLYLQIPPDSSLLPPENTQPVAGAGTVDFLPDATPVQPLAAAAQDAPAENQADVVTVEIQSAKVTLPDFRGMSKRKVLNRCMELGIRLQSKGSGVAVFQSPLPGTKVAPGSSVSVTFTKNNASEHVAALVAGDEAREGNLPLSPGRALEREF